MDSKELIIIDFEERVAVLRIRRTSTCEPVLLLLSVAFFASRLPTRAQTSTGEIDVTAVDTSDAVVTGAHVTVTGADTGNIVRTLSTKASGLAAIPLLNPGTYDVKVEKEGFKTTLRK